MSNLFIGRINRLPVARESGCFPWATYMFVIRFADCKVMMSLLYLSLSALFFLFSPPVVASEANGVETDVRECVVLLHGLARTNNSMNKIADALGDDGYHVVNVGYPSRKEPIETLAPIHIPEALEQCRAEGSVSIHFVTHSMGGILVRYYLSIHRFDELGRVVMLSPPNKGSEVVDKLADMPGFGLVNGPAGQQLGTADDSVPNLLGPVDYPVGVITGNKSINLVLSLLIPGDDDGKVSIERAKVDGMLDFLVVPHTHPMIMRSDNVIAQTKHFLLHGKFFRK